jgi:hypothetical protein
MEESSIYKGKNLIRKNFLLRDIENSSCRNSSYGRNITWKRSEFFSGNMNSLRVMENSSYRSSTVFIFLVTLQTALGHQLATPKRKKTKDFLSIFHRFSR